MFLQDFFQCKRQVRKKSLKLHLTPKKIYLYKPIRGISIRHVIKATPFSLGIRMKIETELLNKHAGFVAPYLNGKCVIYQRAIGEDRTTLSLKRSVKQRIKFKGFTLFWSREKCYRLRLLKILLLQIEMEELYYKTKKETVLIYM